MISQRLGFILLGALGGLAAWVLTELAGEHLLGLWGGRPLLGLGVFALIFFGAGLAILGELGPRRAVISAAALAAPVALLALWKSLGFASAGQMLDTGHLMTALAVLGTIPVPFLVALKLEGRPGWCDYRVLFLESWNIVVRYAAAALFVAVVWGVLGLSAALLKLVGLREFADLLGEPVAVWLISGVALGLGLSVVTEMSDMVSPYLLLRLMRLLLPVLLGVVLVFVAALPLRGLTHLFGSLSAAGILSAVAVAAISLVAIAVDQDDHEAVHAPVLRWSARGLALGLPVLGGLAAWAVALRVGDYGWTPARVTAAAGVAVILGYALIYAGAVLTGRAWMRWLRRGNIVMALAVSGLALLWLSPVISPEALAVRSQIARYESGAADLRALPLWEMQAEWGIAGQRGLARLAARAAEPGQEALAERLALLERDDARWALQRDDAGAQAEEAALSAVLRVLPEGAALPEGLAGAILQANAASFTKDCAEPRADGLPDCLLVLTDFVPADPATDAVLLRPGARRVTLLSGEGGHWRIAAPSGPELAPGETLDGMIAALIAGQGRLVPSGQMALEADGKVIGRSP